MELSVVRGPLAPDELRQWDGFVAGHPQATLYHASRWVNFAADVFGFEPAWITVGSPLAGVMPLIRQSSHLFGERWVSLPFFNYGGPLGVDETVESGLVAAAAELARQGGVQRLEIRDRKARAGCGIRSDKVGAVLRLPASLEALGKALGSKLRSQTRRADRDSPEVTFGSRELVPEFYSVFAETMRDLGTPVYPRRFFEAMLERVGSDCTIVVLRLAGEPAAAAVLTRFRDVTEIPWAAHRPKFRAASANMRLYWECLCHAIASGSRRFDFGRSTRDSGTHRFKLQWGAETIPMYWLYPLAPAGEAVADASGRSMALARRIWRFLPLPFATRVGAAISAGLPW